MRFADDAEATQFFKRLGFAAARAISGGPAEKLKAIRFAYTSPLRKPAEAGSLLASLFPDPAVMLWAADLPFGNRGLEEVPPTDWQSYGDWRVAMGEVRPLNEAPGHVFEAGEADQLALAIKYALILGWDACLGVRSGPVVQFSHNDVVTLYVRSRPASVITGLEKLGFGSLR